MYYFLFLYQLSFLGITISFQLTGILSTIIFKALSPWRLISTSYFKNIKQSWKNVFNLTLISNKLRNYTFFYYNHHFKPTKLQWFGGKHVHEDGRETKEKKLIYVFLKLLNPENVVCNNSFIDETFGKPIGTINFHLTENLFDIPQRQTWNGFLFACLLLSFF